MKSFGVKPDSFKNMRKRAVLFVTVILVSSIVGAAFVTPWGRFDIWVFVVAAAMLLVAAGFGFYRGFGRLRETWPTYSLTIGEDFVLKSQLHHPDIRIGRDEIRAIQRTSRGDIVVKTRDFTRFILIPRSLDGLEEAASLLSEWKPIEDVSKVKMAWAASAAVLALVGALLVLRHFIAGAPLNLTTPIILLFVVLALMIAVHVIMRHHVDKRTVSKRRLLIFGAGLLVVFALALVCRLLGARLGCNLPLFR